MNWWISKIDVTYQIHPAKNDYKYITLVAEEVSGQYFDMTAIFKKLVNIPCEKCYAPNIRIEFVLLSSQELS